MENGYDYYDASEHPPMTVALGESTERAPRVKVEPYYPGTVSKKEWFGKWQDQMMSLMRPVEK